MYALDIETAPTKDTNCPYALEPFRYYQGLAHITSIAVSGPDGYMKQITDMRELPDLLASLKGKEVFCHYAIFDIAWMLAVSNNFPLIESIQWRDTALLAKWLLNSQTTEYGNSTHHNSPGKISFSLANLCKIFLKDHPKLVSFVNMKNESQEYDGGTDKDYWLERGCFDAIMTRELALVLKSQLPESQRRGFIIEQNILPYVARSWLQGIPFNKEYYDNLAPRIEDAQRKLLLQLELPSTIITSPVQLGNYLFNDLKLSPISRTSKGKGSTKAGDLKLLALSYADSGISHHLKRILQYKKLATLMSKYVVGFQKVYSYVGEEKCFGAPRIFGSYTGRFTYSSKTLKKDNYKTSIALHQIPRKGPIKKGLLAFPNRALALNDAAQQELRLVGQCSQDQHLIEGFNSGMDMHSFMSAFIAGEAYEGFCNRLSNEEVDAVNFRYAGKLLNLSCQYRIGATALKRKFFETYDIIITSQQAQMYLNFYKRRYPGVVQYWKDIVVKARNQGYAETLGGRRFGITEWGSKKWMSESSAINTPIQGSAADHKEATLWLVSKKFPEINFMLDVHDELIFDIPNDKDLCREIIYFTNKIDYSALWNKELSLKLPFDSLMGFNFSEKELIK